MVKVENVKKKFTKYKNKKEKEDFYANNGISLEAKEGENIASEGAGDQTGQEKPLF